MDPFVAHTLVNGVPIQRDEVRVRLHLQQANRLLHIPPIEIVASGYDGLELFEEDGRQLYHLGPPEQRQDRATLRYLNAQDARQNLKVLAKLADNLSKGVEILKRECASSGASIVPCFAHF
jgi:hypothetical protein